jgi:hypothetical protein
MKPNAYVSFYREIYGKGTEKERKVMKIAINLVSDVTGEIMNIKNTKLTDIEKELCKLYSEKKVFDIDYPEEE